MNIDIEMYMNYPVEHYNHLENYQQIVQEIVKYKHKFEIKTIFYYKYKHYIITIEPTTTAFEKSFVILHIEDIFGNTYEQIDDDKNYQLNKTYYESVSYHSEKDAAYYENFMEDKQYLLFGNYSGYYKKYYKLGISDYLLEEYYHINGKKEGKYVKYFDRKFSDILFNVNNNNIENNIKIEAYYINNKLNGEYKSFYSNGNIEEICYYQNNNRIGEHKRYSKHGTLIFKCVYDNNGIMTR